jgi:3-oxoadipate enol-lactonase
MRLEFWDAVADRLAPHMQVVALDLRGHGENAPAAEPFSIEDLAADVVALCRALDLPPAAFVGCSMGGMMAQGVALLAPDRVSSLVLANTTHAMSPAGAEVMRQRAERSFRGLEHTVEDDLARWFSEPFRSAHPETVEQARRWVLANDPRTVGHGWQAISQLDWGERLKDVGQPVLVTTGALDPASPPAGARATAAAFPHGSYAEIAGCGHFAPIERPDEFARIVEEFTRATATAGAPSH